MDARGNRESPPELFSFVRNESCKRNMNKVNAQCIHGYHVPLTVTYEICGVQALSVELKALVIWTEWMRTYRVYHRNHSRALKTRQLHPGGMFVFRIQRRPKTEKNHEDFKRQPEIVRHLMQDNGAHFFTSWYHLIVITSSCLNR